MLIPTQVGGVYGADTLLELKDVLYGDLQSAINKGLGEKDMRVLAYDDGETKFVFKNIYEYITSIVEEYLENKVGEIIEKVVENNLKDIINKSAKNLLTNEIKSLIKETIIEGLKGLAKD